MANITITTEPLVETPPVVTPYQQLVAEAITAVDKILEIIPKLAEAEASERKISRGRLGIKEAFIASVIEAVGQSAELTAAKKLDPVAARDKLQCIEAIRPLYDKVVAVEKRLKFTLQWLKDLLVGEAQQVYRIAQQLASDGRSPEMAAHVANMKRALARKVPTKAEREERRLARIQEAAAEMQQREEVQKAA